MFFKNLVNLTLILAIFSQHTKTERELLAKQQAKQDHPNNIGKNNREFNKELHEKINFRGRVEKLLLSANKPISKNGLSAAARKLSSHAQRSRGTFTKPIGGVQAQNRQAERY
ncbi:hypothetical protein QJU43_05145 [Pasteurella atlantica]|uniref:hypothetical protein n=1 Tax=Pasteurellaceae TaxID=712 RepID=UPI002761FD72|nr:hypothetical protein [Pasteurella atlantica]MDP8034271.1 hypothetical protein [Pasteurella atlantica]MDP8036204.1 hypothetical protein [Pasteurella atlantica]MDP8038154.1 hypothetical protein [Pasteurella atlantica]MDP8048509.1 hypothetical protein [Pasteurella atlantica]MDP8050426.1 hypothetical protein [Pasteurella atlantica]